MAQARLLYKKISISEDVNKLPLPARLLFTWLIAQADDEGKMKGEPSFIKASVVPYTNWSLKLIETYLNQMKDIGLIYYWQQNSQRYIEFPKWLDHQHIRKDRFAESKLPSFEDGNDNPTTTKRQPNDNQVATQANVSKVKAIEVNKSEYKKDTFAFNNTYKKSASSFTSVLDPKQYQPQNASEVAAKDAWVKLEPTNNKAFYTTYLKAAHDGLPPSYFYTFVSEIRQSNCNNKGAVFNSKAKSYLDKRASTTDGQSSRLSS